jgi:predicted DNA-binding transcriptional regulator
MSDQTDILTRTLTRLGLTPEEVEIYLHLLASGTKSALEISRELHFARTRVYRLLDKLEAQGLVTQRFADLGLKFTASPHRQLELLLVERQSELDALRQSMPAIFGQLTALERGAAGGSHVFYHHGIDGLKHVTWNSLRAKGELRIYEVAASMTAFLPQEFSERVREELVTHKIHTLQLTNIAHIEPWTNVTENVLHFWTPRYIGLKELTIKSEIVIYNNVTAMYHYLNKDIFCVEIENADLATMQRQMFDYIWSHAKSMGKIGEHGEANVVL